MKVKVFTLSLLMGFVAYALVSIVSDKFEPFDSELGFYLGQFCMSAFAIFISWKFKFLDLLITTLGLYLGLVSYGYIFGSGDAKAWFVLSLVTLTSLCIIPFLLGSITILIKKFKKYK
jgi:hypothetical protein